MELTDIATEAGLVPAKLGIQKVRYTHEAMIDLIISNPWISQNSLAAHFGYSASWISTVFASDAFQARMAERREEIVDPAIKATIEERFKALVLQSMEILKQKLDMPASQVPPSVALKTLEVASKSLGFGARVETPPVPIGGPDRLDVLAERLTGLLAKKKEVVYDGEAQVVSPQEAVQEVSAS
jgi:hypothetical protein